jgi:hypothetical protein
MNIIIIEMTIFLLLLKQWSLSLGRLDSTILMMPCLWGQLNVLFQELFRAACSEDEASVVFEALLWSYGRGT